MKILTTVLAALLLGACATHAVRCGRHLTPINLPAHAAPAALAAAGGKRR